MRKLALSMALGFVFFAFIWGLTPRPVEAMGCDCCGWNPGCCWMCAWELFLDGAWDWDDWWDWNEAVGDASIELVGNPDDTPGGGDPDEFFVDDDNETD